jgi:tetratricopeptide (TPR) repeat protein
MARARRAALAVTLTILGWATLAAAQDAPALRWGWGAEGDMPPPLRTLLLDGAREAMQASGRFELARLGDAADPLAFRRALRGAGLDKGAWFGLQQAGGRRLLFAWLVDAAGGEPPFRSAPIGEHWDRPLDLACRLAWELAERPLAPAANKLVAQGRRAWAAGDLPAADQFYRQALIVTELATLPCRDAAQMYLDHGRPDAALPWLQAALARNPRDFLAYLWMARAYDATGETEQERQALEAALSAGPRIPSVLIALADCDRRTERIRDAQELLREAVRLDPDDRTANLALVNIAEINHDWAVAAPALRRELEMAGGSDDLHRQLAWYQQLAGDYAGAEQTIKDLRARKPNDEGLFRDYALLLVEMGRFAEAEPLLTKYVAARHDAAWAYAALGRICYQSHRYPEAISHLERAHDLDPGDDQIERMLNKAVDLSGDKATAFAYYEARLIRQRLFANDDLERYLSLAQELNRLDRAEATLKRLQASSPRPSQKTAATVALGRLLEKQGRTNEAINVYRELLKRRDRPPTVLFEIGRLSYEAKDYQQGSIYFGELAFASNDVRLLTGAARVAQQAGDLRTAVDLLGEAYRADPNAPTVGVLYLEGLLLAGLDRENGWLVFQLDQSVKQEDERELLYWLELYWAASTDRNDYYAGLLPAVLRALARRPATRVELKQWPATVQQRIAGPRQAQLLDLLAVFGRTMRPQAFATKHHIAMEYWPQPQ